MDLDRPGIRLNTQRLREDLYIRGWLQKDLARAAGLSDATVSKVMRSERASLKSLALITNALDAGPPHKSLGRLITQEG